VKLKKLLLLIVIVVALLSTGYVPVVSAAEKNSCDVLDAPDVDLTNITSDLQAKIDELTSLQSFLKKARADLADSADKEEAYSVLLKIATTVKTVSSVVLYFEKTGFAATPTAFVTTVISNLISTVNDAVNSNNQKELLTDLAKNHMDKWSTILDSLGKAKAFTGAWSSLSFAYDTFLNFAEMADAWTSKATLRSQLKGIDKQLVNLNGKITTLKTNLTKMKKMVGDNEKTLDKSFLDLINKAKKDTAKSCEVKKSGYIKIANDGSELPDSAKLGTKPKDWACTKDNKTSLIWEVKTNDGGLRDKNNEYTNYDAIYPKCDGTNCEKYFPSKLGASTNTDGFVKAVNAQGLCGSSNWRLPTKDELLTISPAGYGTGYFEDINHWYWSSSPYASSSSYAWYVVFDYGNSVSYHKNGINFVRLVR
jgi:hypothetical protein